MAEEKQEKPRRPFHETIVDAIRFTSAKELELLADLIKGTKIPKNHDQIIAAWKNRCLELGWGNSDLGVPADLLEQKEIAACEANREIMTGVEE